MKLQARITPIKDVVGALGLITTIAVVLASILVFLLVGALDRAVWLFKTD